MTVSALTSFVNKAYASQYVRHTAANTLGLLASAALPLVTIPILARIYSPAEYGVFGLYMAISGIGTLTVTGRYEVTIVIPKDDLEAAEVALGAAAVAVLASLALSLLCYAAILIAPGRLPLDDGLVGFLSLPILVGALAQVLLNYAIRQQAFYRISLSRVAASAATAIVTIALGLLKFGAWGLVLGSFANQVVLSLMLSDLAWRQVMKWRSALTVRGIWHRLGRFRAYPTYSLPSDFANTLAAALPVMAFSGHFGAVATGYLVMFQRVWAGSTIVGKGLGETFRQKAAAQYAETGNFKRTYEATLWPLASVAGAALLAMVLIGPQAFALVLGEHWREAGVYAQILAPYVCLQLIASPLSWSFYIVEKLRHVAIWQFSLLFTYLVALGIGIATDNTFTALSLLSVSGTVLYGVYIYVSYRLSFGHSR